MVTNYDFSGWATRNDVKCSDGRTIRENAFKHHDGQSVPLVWSHNHKDANNVLGHAVLENRKEGVYAFGFFNDTEQGQNAKTLVAHKDITSLSIYANQLKQSDKKDVTHGVIREVSLVLAGANPGAYIDTVMVHEDSDTEEATIFNPSEELALAHTDEQESKDEESKKDLDHKDDSGKDEESEKNLEHKDKDSKDEKEKKEMAEKTVKDVVDSMSEEQKNVMYALIGEALENNKMEQSDKTDQGDETEMKHNVFDGDQEEIQTDVLSHDEMLEIVSDAKRDGSLREAFLKHGIENIDNLFPEVQSVNKTPEMIAREMSWVGHVMSRVKKSPFSRVKSTAANLTADAARARGYVKGSQKVEEVIASLKRTTTPTTVYKFQKMDRDDVIDITDFDVVAWLKKEMRMMLDEEIARAILVGDGRLVSDDSHINATHVRPILGDDTTYTVKRIIEGEGVTDPDLAKAFIVDIIRARKSYKGSGNPTLYTTEDMLTEMLLIQDAQGRDIYDSVEKLKTKLRVANIVTVEPMENIVRTDGVTNDWTLAGILVNLVDYNVGADKGGNVNFFEDFDLNFNKHEYLIESRFSGALVKPYSAVSFEVRTPYSAG